MSVLSVAEVRIIERWVGENGNVCQGIGTEQPHPSAELVVVGDDQRRRVLCPACASVAQRAISGRPRR